MNKAGIHKIGDWNLYTGPKGAETLVWREESQVYIREDILAFKRRWRVFEHGRKVAAFETLREAQTETLRRLINLAEAD